MVNSDNVVRGGLTPKYKDTETLTEMLVYKFQDVNISDGELITNSESVQVKKYATGYREFCVYDVVMAVGSTHILPKFPATSIVIVLDGKIGVEWAGMKTEFNL